MKRLVFIIAAAACAAGCAHCPMCGASWDAARREKEEALAAAQQYTEIRGSVTILERTPILPTYRIVVRASRSFNSEVLAETEIPKIDGFPAPFKLDVPARWKFYSDAVILSAQLLAGETVLFETDTWTPLTTERTGQYDLTLARKK